MTVCFDDSHICIPRLVRVTIDILEVYFLSVYVLDASRIKKVSRLTTAAIDGLAFAACV